MWEPATLARSAIRVRLPASPCSCHPRRKCAVPIKDAESRKAYHREYSRGHYERNKARYIQKARLSRDAHRAELYAMVDALKDQPCVDCGGRFPPVCMDFDHVRGTKIESVGRLVVRAVSKARVLAEIAKCELRCANCHRIKTHTTSRV